MANIFGPRKDGQDPREAKVTERNLEEQKKLVFSKAKIFVQPLIPAKHKALFITMIIAAFVMLLFLGTMSLLIYRYQSENRVIYRITSILPFPAARVEGELVTYGSYLFHLNTEKQIYSNPQGLTIIEEGPIDFTTPEGQDILENLRQKAFYQAVEEVVVRILAEREGVSISDEEIDAVYEERIRQTGGQERAKEVLEKYFDWSTSDFKDQLHNNLLKSRLQPRLSTAERAKAEEALRKIRAGEVFAEVAKAYSEDETTKATGGDLGLIVTGSIVDQPQLNQAIIDLPVGQVSEIVESEDGFEIISVTREEAGQKAVAHIFIAYRPFEQIRDDYLQQVRFQKFIQLEE